jgi:hypothetical protein
MYADPGFTAGSSWVVGVHCGFQLGGWGSLRVPVGWLGFTAGSSGVVGVHCGSQSGGWGSLRVPVAYPGKLITANRTPARVDHRQPDPGRTYELKATVTGA